MIKIFTVYFEGKYRPDYVTKLYHSLKRNCKVPFEFICLSDTKEVEASAPQTEEEDDTMDYFQKLANS